MVKKVKNIKKIQANKALTRLRRDTPSQKSLKTTISYREEELRKIEQTEEIKLYMKFYENGINLANALKMSLSIDKRRSKDQIGGFFINGKRYVESDSFKSLKVAGGRIFGNTDVFRFTVQSSGLYLKNHYGIASNETATKHFVDIQWAIPKEVAPIKEILYSSPIKFQCSCGRFTYWYRYIATQGQFGLGKQEQRFPVVRNKQLQGVLCKHLIKVMTHIPNSGFEIFFEREVAKIREGKRARITKDDKRLVYGV